MQKYKVFLNEKSIQFTPSAKITLRKPPDGESIFANEQEVNKWLDDFEKSNANEVIFDETNVESAFHNFRKNLININAAGGVVIRGNTLLFIFRNGKWDLPKGKIEKKETPEIAALREVQEECGIQGHEIVKELPSTYHVYRSPYKKNFGKWIFKETFWFAMNYSGEDNGIPELDENITKLRWFNTNNLDEVLANTYGNLKLIIECYFD